MLPKTATNNSLKTPSGIVLFAKRPGVTSFSSLFTIKHALHTSKVGHTGTLDSFACGLLVVCTGVYTRLASRITAFDKTYEALIEFGSETDTLDPEGTVIKTADLPSLDTVKDALCQFTGELMQTPPLFSAIHIDGKRASELMRAGESVSLPARPVTVYESTLLDVTQDKDGKVKTALVRFHVSKGTYIRSLARDIAESCHSAAHLIGLKRTAVGSFKLEDAVGFEYLDVDIDKDQYEQNMEQQITGKMRLLDESLAHDCGFTVLHVTDKHQQDFYHGRPLRPSFFIEQLDKDLPQAQYVVLSEKNEFIGVVEQHTNALKYGFVVHS